MNEIVTLLKLTLFIYNFYMWLVVMFCLFANALYDWNITKTNSCVHLNVIGEYIYISLYWAIQRSWFARVNALCNLSRKRLREVAAHLWADF